MPALIVHGYIHFYAYILYYHFYPLILCFPKPPKWENYCCVSRLVSPPPPAIYEIKLTACQMSLNSFRFGLNNFIVNFPLSLGFFFSFILIGNQAQNPIPKLFWFKYNYLENEYKHMKCMYDWITFSPLLKKIY